jgi:hypothetical protein
VDVDDFLSESMLGGPGLDGYTYDADVICSDCAENVMRDRARAFLLEHPEGVEDPAWRDSEEWPQPIFFGEADTAQHCGACEVYLYGPEEAEE